MKYINKIKTIGLLVLCGFSVLAQQTGTEIKSQLPELIGPSPTVAALMKYEEIPVSNYTGVPSITIPFFSYKFPSNKISINVGLSYHSQSTKLNEVASDIGLGWSLTGSGSISRSVRGMPDELISPLEKYGVYRNNQLNGNNYYQVLQLMQNNGMINYQAPINIAGGSSPDMINEFLWETDAKGKYDTQHDLWQYNFLGHSGRFYIEKQSNGTLEVKLLEDSTLKIINHYNPVNSNTPVQDHYKPIGFTIYDTFGYKYTFDVIEVTQSSQFSETTAHNGTMNMSLNSETFNSAFHLSKVFDNNNNLLIEYNYLNAGEEHIINGSFMSSYATDTSNLSYEINQAVTNYSSIFGSQFILGLYKPQMTNSASDNTYLARKLSEINLTGVGKIIFNYQIGRQDEDYINKQNVLILKGVTVKDLNNNSINNYELQHVYKNATKNKLFLNKIIQNSVSESMELYSFSYKEPGGRGGILLNNPTSDYWGFLTNIPDSKSGFYKEVNPNLVSMYSLEKMVLPTKGSVVFNYESNTFSSVKDDLLTNFDDNPYNWDEQYAYKTFTTINNNLESFFTLNETQDVIFTKEINLSTNDWAFYIYKDIKSPSTFVGAVSSYSTFNALGYTTLHDLQPGNYLVEFAINDIPPSGTIYNAKIYATYKTKNSSNYKNYLYGGGFRIAKISTYNTDVNTSNIQQIPTHVRQYKYNYFDNTTSSSGSLTSKIPAYEYSTSQFRPELRASTQGGALTLIEQNHLYDIFSSLDKINRNKTQGAEIGYKNVSVAVTNNGRTEYTYTSSLDYPDEELTISELYFPSLNYDYKRGLITKEEIFNKDNKKLVSTTYSYLFEDYLKLAGLHVFGTYDQGFNSCPTFKLMSSYDNYKYIKSTNCQPSSTPCSLDQFNNTFRGDLNIGYHFLLETYGWAKLVNKTTKNYFYPSSSSIANISETNETYTYNPTNKQISESTITNSTGETLKTKYFYHTGNSVYSQNRIGEIESIESYNGAELLSKSKINYGNTWQNNVSLLPQSIETSKGVNTLENRLEYKQYDQFSNPLEVQLESGIPITYIWGYNKTQPIAKIENATYAEVQQYEANLQTLSNGTDEANLITALDNLRTALPNAMVTTYTYKPLVGISTVTDQKGNKITYHYDSFNHLEFVKDQDGNDLNKNEYHYKN